MTTDKAPYFYAAYALVWGALLVYTLWLTLRVKTLEERIDRKNGGSSDR